MGMDKAKSLLPVRDGKSFLDIIVDQVLSARATHGATLPLVVMDSLRTQDDTLAALAPYAAEICRRTAADRKGGHLAIRKADQQLILRDTAQTSADEMHFFTDEFRHPYFHTNNLWFDLEVLSATLTERNAVLGLPLIKNEKTVDPADSSSPEVIQIESAMGAAIEVFEGATAIGVGRERFLPVKTTNDLLLLQSDVYEVGSDGLLTRVADPAPLIDLDTKYYKTIGKFSDRFRVGAPSLKHASSLTVKGDWTFESGVVVKGAATLADSGERGTVTSGTVLEG
jgi:UTP--glucose-1-phosphate uridylyltransferase